MIMKFYRSIFSRLTWVCLLLTAIASARGGIVSLVDTNAAWKWRKGTNEASLPDTAAWRAIGFDDSSFVPANAPFWYGDGYTGGTPITDMLNNYLTIYMRKTFVVTNPAVVSSLRMGSRCDDGFVARRGC